MIFHIIHSQKPKTFGIFFSELFGRIKTSMRPGDQISKLKTSRKELLRRKLFFNSLKKSLVIISHKNIVLAKRQKVLDIRKQKLENYRIDYLPMGWENDFK